ncbi:MAG: phospholipase D family protein [Bryobacteraceae bacterium]|nr:phospholipase D family protein [Bryobacteraceae bacterium]
MEKFQKRGVELYLRADLHAKVCLLGRHVIIGSANLSAHSRDVLDEAALYTSDEHIVSIVKKWFEDRMSEPVSPKWLQHCKKIYKPPKDFVAKKPTRRSPSRRVWLLGTDSWDDFPEAELSTIESGEHVAAKMLGDRRRYEVEMIRWTGKPRFRDLMMPGDVIIEAHEGYVYPPGRFLHMRRSKSSRGGDVTYIYYEAIRNPSPIRWARFRGECLKMDLKLGKDVGAKEIKRMQHQDALLKMLSPDRPTR